MKRLFDLNELRQNPSSEARKSHADQSMALSLKHLKVHTEKIKSIRNLAGRPPAPDEIYFLFTENSFNAFTFVPYLLNEHQSIDELHVSTFAINQRVLGSFMHLAGKGLIKKISLLVNDSTEKRLPKVYDQLQAFARAYDFVQVKFAWNHSKITLARCGQQHYVIEGSGNWSENAAMEQYLFTNSKPLFNFRKACINPEPLNEPPR